MTKPEATGPYADLYEMIYQHFTDRSTRAVRPKKSILEKWTGSLGSTFQAEGLE